MMPRHEYVMNETILKTIRARTQDEDFILRCNKCQKPIRIGDSVRSKHKRNRSTYHHALCYEKTLH